MLLCVQHILTEETTRTSVILEPGSSAEGSGALFCSLTCRISGLLNSGGIAADVCTARHRLTHQSLVSDMHLFPAKSALRLLSARSHSFRSDEL